MVYIPNPTDATQPTGSVDASTADDEFRALKGYVAGLALAAGMFAPVRQCANDGVVDAFGNPAFLVAAGAGGLALDLKATSRPLIANFAGGSTGTGINDRNGTYTADTANIVAGLVPSNTSYIFADYVSAGVWTWQSTLAPPQYGKVYDQTKQSVLQFAGAAGSTVFLDDFGNTWTAQGGAKVQTNQIKFGTGALGGAGAASALNGAADYIKSTVPTVDFRSGWSIRGWANPSVLPGAAATVDIACIANTATFGARLTIFNNAGTIRFAMYLSSNGTSHDITSGIQGTTLPVVGTYYFVEMTYDPLGNAGGGTYRLYVNGVQEAIINSSAKVAITSTSVSCVGSANGGAGSFFNGYIDKPEFLSYCQHPAGTAYAVPVAAPSITAVGYASDFFDIQAMKMYTVTAASAVAGIAPTLTQKYRCYLGETDTSALVPTAVRSYAFNGKAISSDLIPLIGAAVSFAHNLGVIPGKFSALYKNITTDAGYSPGDVVNISSNLDNGTNTTGTNSNKNTMQYIQSLSTVVGLKTTGARTATTLANWRLVLEANRGWGGA